VDVHPSWPWCLKRVECGTIFALPLVLPCPLRKGDARWAGSGTDAGRRARRGVRVCAGMYRYPLEPVADLAGQGPTLRVMQWNVLADGLAQTGGFCRCPPEKLEWAHRGPRILREILDAQADVVCLQEVNFYERVLAEVGPMGFDGVFLEKQDSPAARAGAGADGIALLWRRSALRPVAPPDCAPYAGGKDNPGRTVALFEVLKGGGDAGGGGGRLLVASTHLKAKHGADLDAKRSAQTRELLSAVAGALEGGAGGGTHVIITGDFNTCPTVGDAFRQVLDFGDLGFRSAYALPREGAEAAADAAQGPFTTWKFRDDGSEKKECIDYVFVSRALAVRARRKLPAEDTIGTDALPCADYPSDHLALLVDVQRCAP